MRLTHQETIASERQYLLTDPKGQDGTCAVPGGEDPGSRRIVRRARQEATTVRSLHLGSGEETGWAGRASRVQIQMG